ncbi:polysaccharide pyruvyl transferase family protein [Methyloceanibacter sp.]|uniref:polysaccharide pyruvyl transferase family protein n=1 Tax=Methyloceanibacter sp. TaxID=1965321 RepID=UPI003D6D0B42
MKTIVHIATHTTNIGDGALIKGLQSTLPADIGSEIHFIDHCLTDFLHFDKLSFDQHYVEWLNNNADLLMIGGGGFIMGQKKDTSGLALPFEISLLQQLKIPIVVYAVGYNLFYGETLRNAHALSALIAQIRDLGGLFSVRNDGSKERLEKDLGSAVMNSVWEVPDPGLFVPVEPMLHPQIRSGRRNIVLQLAGDRLASRLMKDSGGRSGGMFGALKKRQQPEPEGADAVWEAIANVCNEISAKHDVNFILAPHIHSDLAIAQDFILASRKIPPPRHFSGFRLEVSGVLRGTRNASGFFDLYRQADLVVGMRGHSTIVSVGAGTPCVGIVSHPKVEGFLKDCGLEKWSANIMDANLEDSLSEKITMLLDDSSEWRALRAAAVEKMAQKRKQFHREIKRLLD